MALLYTGVLYVSISVKSLVRNNISVVLFGVVESKKLFIINKLAPKLTHSFPRIKAGKSTLL